MKVFISWSGSVSHEVALALREWLPSVIQSIDPYVSSEDTDKGARWGVEIGKELEASDFGILCVTPGNSEAPWIQFEAGALSKSLDRSRVVPLLFRLERAELPQGPLVQFQSVLAQREDIEKLLLSLNRACDDGALDQNRLESVFEVWWPKLEDALASVRATDPTPAKTARPEKDVLAEILELVRGQQQRLNDPTSILPLGYIAEAVSRALREPRVPRVPMIDPDAIDALRDAWHSLNLALKRETATVSVMAAVEELAGPMEYLLERYGRQYRRRRGIRRPSVREALEAEALGREPGDTEDQGEPQ
jgi:hypothetical protein